MNDATQSNSRKKLLLLAGIAFVPLFIAYGMFFRAWSCALRHEK